MVRVVVAFGLSAAIYPLIPSPSAVPGQDIPSLVSLLIALGKEALIGLTVGWSAQLLFAGMRLAGQHIEFKMGLGFTQLVDPHEGGQTSLLPALLDLLTALVFLSVNGHHLLILALVSSYQVFPLLGGGSSAAAGRATTSAFPELLHLLIESASVMVSVALRVSAPVVLGALLADVFLGVMSRMVPQLNLFAVILPAQFAFGLLLLFLALPLLVWFCVDQLAIFSDQSSMLFSPLKYH
jgi:flagellar biosynthetic protein FliR